MRKKSKLKQAVVSIIAAIFWGLNSVGYAADINQGLLAYYSFEGADPARDFSGNEAHGVNQGVTFTKGVMGRAGLFKEGNTITVNAFQDRAWGSEFSVSLWFQQTGGWGKYLGLIKSGECPDCSWELRLSRDVAGGALGGGIMSYNDPQLWDFKNINAPPEEWHHVVMTYNGSNAVFFLDGQSKPGTGKDVGKVVRASLPVVMGEGIKARREYFVGMMDEVRIYNRAITSDEVNELYNQGLSGTQAPVMNRSSPSAHPGPPPPPVAASPIIREPRPQTIQKPVPVEIPKPAVQEKPTPIPVLQPEPTPSKGLENVEAVSSEPVPSARSVESSDQILQRWLRLWRTGKKQQVIDELNRHVEEGKATEK